VLELVDRIILRFIDIYHKRSSRFSDNIYIYIYILVTINNNCNKDPFVQRLRQNSFIVKIRVRIPYGLLTKNIVLINTGDIV
jgi:hypothetical protein